MMNFINGIFLFYDFIIILLLLFCNIHNNIMTNLLGGEIKIVSKLLNKFKQTNKFFNLQFVTSNTLIQINQGLLTQPNSKHFMLTLSNIDLQLNHLMIAFVSWIEMEMVKLVLLNILTGLSELVLLKEIENVMK